MCVCVCDTRTVKNIKECVCIYIFISSYFLTCTELSEICRDKLGSFDYIIYGCSIFGAVFSSRKAGLFLCSCFFHLLFNFLSLLYSFFNFNAPFYCSIALFKAGLNLLIIIWVICQLLLFSLYFSTF